MPDDEPGENNFEDWSWNNKHSHEGRSCGCKGWSKGCNLTDSGDTSLIWIYQFSQTEAIEDQDCECKV